MHAIPMHAILIVGASAALLAAMLCDVAFRLIPDALPLALAALGVGVHLLDGKLAVSLGCGAVIFVLAFLCWFRGWMGGGDVKLLAATAILLPPVRVPGFIAAVALAGGVLALLYLALERLLGRGAPSRPAGRAAPHLRRILAIERRRIRRRLSLPYATAIGAAALLMLFEA